MFEHLLPKETHLEIASYLTAAECWKVARTCKIFYSGSVYMHYSHQVSLLDKLQEAIHCFDQDTTMQILARRFAGSTRFDPDILQLIGQSARDTDHIFSLLRSLVDLPNHHALRTRMTLDVMILNSAVGYAARPDATPESFARLLAGTHLQDEKNPASFALSYPDLFFAIAQVSAANDGVEMLRYINESIINLGIIGSPHTLMEVALRKAAITSYAYMASAFPSFDPSQPEGAQYLDDLLEAAVFGRSLQLLKMVLGPNGAANMSQEDKNIHYRSSIASNSADQVLFWKEAGAAEPLDEDMILLKAVLTSGNVEFIPNPVPRVWKMHSYRLLFSDDLSNRNVCITAASSFRKPRDLEKMLTAIGVDNYAEYGWEMLKAAIVNRMFDTADVLLEKLNRTPETHCVMKLVELLLDWLAETVSKETPLIINNDSCRYILRKVESATFLEHAKASQKWKRFRNAQYTLFDI